MYGDTTFCNTASYSIYCWFRLIVKQYSSRSDLLWAITFTEINVPICLSMNRRYKLLAQPQLSVLVLQRKLALAIFTT